MPSSTMERLLSILIAPLLMVAPKKKKAIKPASRKLAKRVRPSKKTVRSKKPSLAKQTRKTAPRPIKKKGKAPILPAQPAVVAKAEVREPTPKPVAPTGRAILITPENDKFTDSVHPTFRWLSVGGANRYEVAWSETPDFAHPWTIISDKTEATVPVEKVLRLGVVYSWHVRGGNEGGWGPWSATASFRVLEGEE